MAQHLTALAVIILLITQGISAKRGCSAFGHSCFGGHGKRSGDNAGIETQNGDNPNYRRQLGQEETPPHPGYPRSAPAPLSPGDDIIPIRDGGVYDHDENNAMKEYMKFRLRSIVKHWMDNYRRTQQSGDDGFYVGNL
ncbi:neuropeptide CCHamide-2 [Plutella xylostella]|uniref:neuropeptide CCHamide-2 n=1 Tax=Plutella xylostella TaxID=51655 RepID=UPI002032DDFE|nr:neuropeptide CCHamide-2 [Plutella xylostella]